MFADMDIWHIHQPVVAIDVLPGLAPFTEDRVPIVVIVAADATDGVRLLLFWGD